MAELKGGSIPELDGTEKIYLNNVKDRPDGTLLL